MPQIISIEQLRAARGLLGWTQAKLAQMSKLSVPAIARLERSEVDPRVNTLERLQNCFEAAGVEFTDNSGVRKRGEQVKIELWDGADCIAKFMDDYFATLVATKTEGLFSGIDEQAFALQNKKQLAHNLQRMAKLGLTERILLKQGDTFIAGPPHVTTYHWICADLWGQVPYILYGDKLAVIFQGPPQRVLVIDNPSLAQTYRQQFEVIWQKSSPVPYSPKELQEKSAKNLK